MRPTSSEIARPEIVRGSTGRPEVVGPEPERVVGGGWLQRVVRSAGRSGDEVAAAGEQRREDRDDEEEHQDDRARPSPSCSCGTHATDACAPPACACGRASSGSGDRPSGVSVSGEASAWWPSRRPSRAGRGRSRGGRRPGSPRSRDTLKIRKSPCSRGKSGSSIAVAVSRPRPGQLKISSIVMAPEIDEPQRQDRDGHRRQQGVRDGVALPDGLVPQALRARQLDVVLAQRLQQRRAHDQRVLAEVGDREDEERQDHVVQDVGHVLQPRVARPPAVSYPPVGKIAGKGPTHGERHDHEQAEPELGHRVREQREAEQALVEPGPSPPALGDADPDADRRSTRSSSRRSAAPSARPHPPIVVLTEALLTKE